MARPRTATPQRWPIVLPLPSTAPGAEPSLTVPGDEWWELWSWQIHFVGSGAAVTRTPQILIQDPNGNIVFRGPTSTTIAGAGSDLHLCWATGVGAAYATFGKFLIPLPTPVPMRPGSQFIQSTVNLDAGDQYLQGAALIVATLTTAAPGLPPPYGGAQLAAGF